MRLRSTVSDPRGVPLSKKLTVPVGVPLVVEATLAVLVTFKSNAMVGVLRVVVVTVGAFVTDSVPL